MQALIDSGVHENIAAFLAGDDLSFRSFCTCGGRELLTLWRSATQPFGTPGRADRVFVELYHDYRDKLCGKLVRRVLASERVGNSNATTDVGEVYVVLHKDAPAALDMLDTFFHASLRREFEMIGLWVQNHLDSEFVQPVMGMLS
ncbi:hypothetical protein WJX73_010115 [Symbiochloris irregularis]|uniref:Uncharacterized protein n=1 Tax=Symbiochloris irregularis TaxID=706552 RepID=A0AAW1PV54_9CHLO